MAERPCSTPKFASRCRPKRPKVFMKKKVVPQETPIAVGSQLSNTSVESLRDSPVLTASSKKLALSSSSTSFPESLQPES